MADSSLAVVLNDSPRASLYIESFTTSLRSRELHPKWGEMVDWFITASLEGVSGKRIRSYVASASALQSREDTDDEQEENDALDDSVEILCLSFTPLFKLVSCN